MKWYVLQNEKRNQEGKHDCTKRKKHAVIDGETLMDARLPKRNFCVETLLPEGISMLGGAPKVGKSWMVLLLALQVAKGDPLWNLPTKQGTVLYLALEDSQSRLQDRLNRLTDEAFQRNPPVKKSSYEQKPAGFKAFQFFSKKRPKCALTTCFDHL